MNNRMISIIDQLFNFIVDLPFCREVKKLLCKWERSIISSYSCNRWSQRKEAFLLKHSWNLSSYSTGAWCFMGDDTSSSFIYRFYKSLTIVWINCLQIDNLTWDTILFSHLSYCLKCSHQITIADKSDIFTFIDYFSFFQGQAIISDRNMILCISI